jgi:hypothetical protein
MALGIPSPRSQKQPSSSETTRDIPRAALAPTELRLSVTHRLTVCPPDIDSEFRGSFVDGTVTLREQRGDKWTAHLLQQFWGIGILSPYLSLISSMVRNTNGYDSSQTRHDENLTGTAARPEFSAALKALPNARS